MNTEILKLLQTIAGDGDLARQYPQYREAAVDILTASPNLDAELVKLAYDRSPSAFVN